MECPRGGRGKSPISMSPSPLLCNSIPGQGSVMPHLVFYSLGESVSNLTPFFSIARRGFEGDVISILMGGGREPMLLF